jgi:acetyl esterase/lipase
MRKSPAATYASAPPRPRLRRWTAAAITAVTLFLAAWIVIPGPTYFFLRLSVGAPEVGLWLAVASAVACLLLLPDLTGRRGWRVVLACALLSLGLALSPLIRFQTTARRFDAAMEATLGARVPKPTSETRLLRVAPLVPMDLVRGIDLGAARITRGIPVAQPDGIPLTVDVYRPAGGGNHPIIVQIYGGAWQGGAPGSNAKAAQWLAAHGWVVFAIDYRHAPRSRWPAHLHDVRTALAWIRDHAAEYDADPTRVALMGRSAGAHLAMLAGYTPGPLPVRAVISLYGPVDLVDAYLHPPSPDPLRIREVQDTLFGGTLEQMRERYVGASPIEFATRPQPPTLLVYAGRDHIAEPRYGARLHQQLTSTGTRSVYLEIPWADHAFDEIFNGPSNQLALYHVERFLAWAFAGGADTVGR